ncbi:glycoside hydrolase family 28 protein [Frigidibacter mobilis]|uniref:Polygalacturonase-like protein n=1 Tax=Frigidibacter mobilis TaxID=1335048 RepID=A0A159Z6U0_9RHOB|nr:glycoside hydrolase family 28 protein [Frigidibacter mobilis]AMY71086.1 polygalacturonase-like protein [Frigidibacter mobilis]
MPRPHTVALAARSAALRLARPGALFRLDPAIAWRLTAPGLPDREGLAGTVVLALHDLQPATRYTFEAEGFEAVEVQTLPCAGLLDIRDFAADPDAPDNAAAFAAAIAALPAGGTLRVTAGTWTTGPIFLRSAMTLQLDEGATLAAPADRSRWPILPARDAAGGMLGSWEGLPDACHAALITAIGGRDLIIAGPGRLDGGGDRGDWWQWPKDTRRGARRARSVHLIGCEDVTLLGPTVCNSPSWTVHPQGCRGLTIAALAIEAPHDSPNTDGLNPESCTDVVIEGVRFSVGDDCIALKAGKRAPGCTDHLALTKNIAIRHCLMERGHGGVVIGSEMSGSVQDVLVEHCEMIGTDRGLRIKTRRGRGGRVSGITMRHVRMDGVLTAFTANAFYHCDADGHDAWVQDRAPAPAEGTTPQVSDITISDVTIVNLSHAAGAFLGLPEAPIRGVRISRVTILSHDPAALPAPPLMADHVRAMRHEAITAEWTDIETDDPALLTAGPITATD